MSILFYAWGEPKFVLIMLGSLIVNWFFGMLAGALRGQPEGRAVITATVLFNIGILFVYKYLGFTARNLQVLFDITLNVPAFVLPIGISFYTFQAMSYVFDCYRGKGEPQKNPLNTALYIMMFPQLIAGPIVRYETIAKEINTRKFDADDFSQGVKRFVYGMSKKVLIANVLAVTADAFFNLPDYSSISMPGAWLGAVAYTLQIYFDFSGYSDMAIGLGLMFGFHFNENFNYPYAAGSITDFWRRWHISLSSWFRDYVYFPLGGSRVDTKQRLVFNLFAVWMLTGIWHGASWNFVFWGFFYFVLLTAEKLLDMPKRLTQRKIWAVLYRIFTLIMVMLGWVFFRAPGLKAGFAYLRRMFSFSADSGFAGILANDAAVMLIAGIALSFPVAKLLANTKFGRSKPALILQTVALPVLMILCIASLAVSSYNPFIYFNF
jgi:alginate O-acetyltransferase complex protein AlgI